MADFGLTLQGFEPRVLTDIVADEQQSLRDVLGQSLDFGSHAVLGAVVGSLGERFAELWEVGQAVYSALDPDQSEGDFLDVLCALTGTVRLPARSSRVTLTCTGDDGTVLPVARVASVDVTGARFATVAEVTLELADAWAGTTPYALGDFASNDGSVWVCRTAGTSAGSGGPTGEDADVTDGTVHWRHVGGGLAFAQVVSDSEVAAPVAAQAFAVANIETPVAGWTDVVNLLDARLGRLVESDELLRIRREAELLGNARSALPSIRTRVLEDVDGVTVCYVFQNNTEDEVGGMPARSVEVLAVGGTDEDVARAVLGNVAGGMTWWGNTEVDVADLENASQTFAVKFTRPTEKPLYVALELDIDAATYPADGDDQVIAALLAYGLRAYVPGKDGVAHALRAQAFKVPGVLDAPVCDVGLSPSPSTEATVPVAIREYAALDSSRVTVATTPVVP